MKYLFTLLIAGLAAAGLAQSLPSINVHTVTNPVVNIQPQEMTVVVTNKVRVTNQVAQVVVDPLTLTQQQMDGVIAMCAASGISASTPITTTNLQYLYLTRGGGTNGVPVSFTVRFQLKP